MSATTELGKAYVQILPSAKGIKGNMEKEMSSMGGSMGQIAGKGLATSLIGAISFAAIGQMIVESLNLGSRLQQALGGSEAVFGEHAKKIQQIAKTAYKNMGMSQEKYLSSANKIASLFQGSGMSQEKSLNLTSEAMQRASDVASVMGVDMEMAMEAIAGAAKGNYTMMDNLGVAMNATTLKAYALEKGINFDWNTSSNAEKSELALKMFMDRTSQYAGNFAKESENTFSGSLGALVSSFQNFIADLTLGNDITESLSAMLESSGVFLFKNLVPMVWNLGKGLVVAISNLLKNSMSNLFKMGSGGTIDQFIKNLPAMINKLTTILNDFIDNLFNKIIPELLPKIGEFVKNVATSLLLNSPQLMMAIFNLLMVIREGMFKFSIAIFQGFITIIGSLFTALIEAGKQFINWAATFFLDVKNGFLSFKWLQIGIDIMAGIGQGIMEGLNSLLETVKQTAQSIWDSITGFFDIHSPSRKMAWVGKMIDKGMADGINDNYKIINDSFEKISSNALKTFDSTIQANSDFNANISKDNGEKEGYTQNITINSPESLNPSEIARQTKNTAKLMFLKTKGV